MYEPADLAASLADAAADIMPWVGAAVGGGLALLFVFMAIRAAVGLFRSIAYERSGDRAYDDALYAAESAEHDQNMADWDDYLNSDEFAAHVDLLRSERDGDIDRISKNF
jgi:hypothetical protein